MLHRTSTRQLALDSNDLAMWKYIHAERDVVNSMTRFRDSFHAQRNARMSKSLPVESKTHEAAEQTTNGRKTTSNDPKASL